MVSVADIREFLLVDEAGQSDAFIQKLIDRTVAQVKTYCNNNFEDGLPIDIEDVVIQWVCMKYDVNTRLRNGKSSQGMGQMSISYMNEIPKEFKSILNQHRRLKTL